MNAEERLRKELSFDSHGNLILAMTLQDLIKILDEHARDRAVEFAKWNLKECREHIDNLLSICTNVTRQELINIYIFRKLAELQMEINKLKKNRT